MQKSMIGVLVIALALAGLGAAGARVAAERQDPGQVQVPLGELCVVHFRRDALGLAARVVVAPGSATFGETDLRLTGLYRKMDADWLVIDRVKKDGGTLWIPREVILYLEVPAP